MNRILYVFLILLAPFVGRTDERIELPARQTAWEHVQRIGADREYPVFAQGGLVLVSCEHNGALLALDANSGAERWRFYTEGPLRKPATGDGERIFFGSQDGRIYCLDQAGKLMWSRVGGHGARKVIGHERMISAWPISATPLVDGDVVYAVAGYWPLEGVYVYALDAKTGTVRWRCENVQARPDRLWLSGDLLIVDGHNSKAVIDRRTGSLSREKAPKRPPMPAVEVKRPFKVGKPPELAPMKGYALIAGLKDGVLLERFLREGRYQVVAFDADAEKVAALRRKLDDAGLLAGRRAALFAAGADEVRMPPYFASLVTSETGNVPAAVHECLRPFGGVMELEGRVISRRDGPLPGAADWSQEFCNEANTLGSPESLARAPLGVLWYDGPISGARYYYDGNVDHQSGNGINPQPVPALTLKGRMLLQSPGLLAAFDQYTGRLLWEAPLPTVYSYGGGGGGLGKHSKKHPRPMHYDGAMNFDVKPRQRSRASGFNFGAAPDGIYVCAGPELLRFDPATGEQLSAWKVPLDESALCWGGLRIAGDVLVATAFDPQDLVDVKAGEDGQGGDWAGDRMPMRHLFGLDRRSGAVKWHRPADSAYVNRSGYCIGNGRVYLSDVLIPRNLENLREAGRELPEAPPRVLALDLDTGKELWSMEPGVLVRNIAYSEKHDLLLTPCRNLMAWEDGTWVNKSIDARRGKTNKNAPGLMRGLRGRTGEEVWRVDTRPYHHPHVLLSDLIIDRHGYTYDLATGKRAQRNSPLTGEPEVWSFRKGGCNHLIGCANLVTWRTAFYDLENQSGVMKLNGLDAGCSPTLIPAGGLVNIPNFGTHHKRNRMTAMALVHVPDNPLWTTYYSSSEKGTDPAGAAIKRVGYNFAAPGDRLAEDGTLWQRIDTYTRYGLRIEPRQEVRYLTGAGPDWIRTGAVSGARSIRVPLKVVSGGKEAKNDKETRTYTLRLHFHELEGKAPGERVFSIQAEGRPLLEDFDIAAAGGSTVKEFKGVQVEGPLDLELNPLKGRALLNGIELVLEP